MEKSINVNEVANLIANELNSKGLNNIIDAKKIKEAVMKKIQEAQEGIHQGINEMENPVVAKGPTVFPNPAENEEQFKMAPDVVQPEAPKVGMEAGAQPLNVPMEPKTAIPPQVPDFLKDVEPGKVFVFDFNELSVGGENLSNKPFQLMNSPFLSKSMQEMWSENGTTKAEVYQTKFEKIGEIAFDYKSGSSQFIQKSAEPDFDVQQQYKENPYAAEPNKEIEAYVKNNVNIDQKINDVITNIVKDYFLTNSERATNAPSDTVAIPGMGIVGHGDIKPKNVLGTQNPIQEHKISVRDLVNNFQKIDTPQELIETIEGKTKQAKLIYEDKEIKKWLLDGKEYYLPTNPMSIRKCYLK